MEAKDLIAKTRIARAPTKYNPDEKYIEMGYVLAPPEEDPLTKKMKCYVKWDDKYSWRKSNPEEVEIDTLIPKAEADVVWSQLESEYKKAEEQIKAKMAATIQTLKEAQTVASEAKMILPEFHEATYKFRQTIEECGWNLEQY